MVRFHFTQYSTKTFDQPHPVNRAGMYAQVGGILPQMQISPSGVLVFYQTSEPHFSHMYSAQATSHENMIFAAKRGVLVIPPRPGGLNKNDIMIQLPSLGRERGDLHCRQMGLV